MRAIEAKTFSGYGGLQQIGYHEPEGYEYERIHRY